MQQPKTFTAQQLQAALAPLPLPLPPLPREPVPMSDRRFFDAGHDMIFVTLEVDSAAYFAAEENYTAVFYSEQEMIECLFYGEEDPDREGQLKDGVLLAVTVNNHSAAKVIDLHSIEHELLGEARTARRESRMSPQDRYGCPQ